MLRVARFSTVCSTVFSKTVFSAVCSVGLLSTVGCNFVPHYAYQESQMQNQHFQQQQTGLEQQNMALTTELTNAQAQLHTANQRITNLNSERTALKQRLVGLVNKSIHNPIGSGPQKRLQELANKYKHFDFDPETGISKFHSDVLFASAHADLNDSGEGLLHEFANIMTQADANDLKILVVGHTDNRVIKHGGTLARHPSNWHLSTDRANSVVLKLRELGIPEHRMGSLGYGKHQPVTSNETAHAQQLNRRVEIYVLSPNTLMAGQWNAKDQPR